MYVCIYIYIYTLYIYLSLSLYIYIYMHIYHYIIIIIIIIIITIIIITIRFMIIIMRGTSNFQWQSIHVLKRLAVTVRDKDLYTTTNKCLQCLMKLMYTVFSIIGVYVDFFCVVQIVVSAFFYAGTNLCQAKHLFLGAETGG